MFTMRTLSEGKWVILVLLALGGATWRWCPVRWAPLLPLAGLGFVFWFFRDPPRMISPDPHLIVAPADGTVVEVRPVTEPLFLRGEAQLVAIFLSVFDVHVQRAPVASQIRWVQYQPGQFLDARHPQAGARNEARMIGLETPDGFRCVVRQVAGLIARRIVGWAGEGATLAKGDRLGMIRFGSRVELYLPPGTAITVTVGEHVKGGETILARRR
jgi:phosphatidylserine decarboxylase